MFFYDFHGFSGIRSTQPTGLKPPKLTPMGAVPNRTIRVNLVIFHSILATVDINMLKKHPSKNPLQGLGFCSKTLL